jgi:hypothetical protein
MFIVFDDKSIFLRVDKIQTVNFSDKTLEILVCYSSQDVTSLNFTNFDVYLTVKKELSERLSKFSD